MGSSNSTCKVSLLGNAWLELLPRGKWVWWPCLPLRPHPPLRPRLPLAMAAARVVGMVAARVAKAVELWEPVAGTAEVQAEETEAAMAAVMVVVAVTQEAQVAMTEVV